METHLFQVRATGDLNTAITEWTAFDDDVYNAFVPYYPMPVSYTHLDVDKRQGRDHDALLIGASLLIGGVLVGAVAVRARCV